ncbi:MAG: hypothetical protein KDC67_15310, partial [Ignavibacteriae bacterium]|nr:hypothetical protein [Ignavibacteriota bacterium]
MKILDCTFRDGGYYTNWDFDMVMVHDYIESMNELPIDFIELGYRSKSLAGYYGEFFYCPEYLLKEIRRKSAKKLAVMLNEKDTDSENVDLLLRPVIGLIDLVRIAVNPDRFDSSLILAKSIKDLGFEVGFNIMYMSTWAKRKDFLNKLKLVDGIIDYLY